LVTAGAVAIVATLLSIPLQAGYTTVGGLSKTLDGTALRTVLSARFGRAALVRAGMLVGLVAFIRVTSPRASSFIRHSSEALVALLAVGVWATFAYAGHGNTGQLVGLGFVTDLAHLGAASVWLGGLVALAFALRDRGQREANGRAAASFSKVALPAIGVLVLSGVVQGWRQINTWWALWHTSYGRLLVIKVIVVVAIIIVASASRDLVRDRIVPPVRAALPSGASRLASEGDAVAELRNSIWVEVLLAAVVLAVTASLVVTAPGREAAAAARQPVARTVRVAAAGQHLSYSVVLQPALPGENTIVVTPRLLSQTGFLPFGLTAQVVGPGKGTPIHVTFTALEDGRWVAAAPLSERGDWRLNLTSDISPARDTTSLQLPIG
jgi:copper transport protein